MSDTPRTDAEERNYPLPEYLQLILFEGATVGVIAIEDYRELYEKIRQLERELNEANYVATVAHQEMLKVAVERDQWKQCAEQLAKASLKGQKNYRLVYSSNSSELDSMVTPFDNAIDTFNRLSQKEKE